jgi:hypothetical protein
MTEPKPCKDCEPPTGKGKPRPAPHPGPRCATHHREFRKAQKGRTRDRIVETTYGITPKQYAALKAAQGGRCAVCQVATGRTKALAVDHDHECCPGPVSCGKCVRGLLCGPCNQDVIGRYGIAKLYRAIAYLLDPPARAVIGE